MSGKREQAKAKALRQLAEMSDDEDAPITAAAESDPDNQPLTEEQLTQFRPAAATSPDLVAACRRSRGRPKLAAPKEHINLRLDADVVAHFRATGHGWQSRINDLLRKAAGL